MVSQSDYSCFVVLLARPRSGTSALRSVVSTHPEIDCLDEVFRVDDRMSADPFIREANFFYFLERYANGDITQIFPDRHEQVFRAYLNYLRGLCSKRFILLDVKSTTTHFFTRPFKSTSYPYLFDLIAAHSLRVLHLSRNNYLRCAISQQKAEASGVWSIESRDERIDRPVCVDVATLLERLHFFESEDHLVRGYSHRFRQYWTCDYQDVFSDATGSVAPAVLAQLSIWLEIENCFVAKPLYKKQSYLPLDQTISNYSEVAAALTGTQFAYCLEDEPCYIERSSKLIG